MIREYIKSAYTNLFLKLSEENKTMKKDMEQKVAAFENEIKEMETRSTMHPGIIMELKMRWKDACSTERITQPKAASTWIDLEIEIGLRISLIQS